MNLDDLFSRFEFDTIPECHRQTDGTVYQYRALHSLTDADGR